MRADDQIKLLMGLYFYPRGGSSHACQAISCELERNGVDTTLVAGSLTGRVGDARSFFSIEELRPVDFVPALESSSPLSYRGASGTAPMQASYEDRPGADDPVFATLGEAELEAQVEAWTRELTEAGADGADVLYLHHLTPLHEAARRSAPGAPVVTHIHGSELLMLERIAEGAPAGWAHADEWAERMKEWAAGSAVVLVNSPRGVPRAAKLLDLPEERFTLVPNGFSADFEPLEIDRASHWRRHLVEEPLGWGPGREPGSIGYSPDDLAALDGTVLLSVGRFTAVKRLPLLIEAFEAARGDLDGPTALVLLGGFPGEWEGEHPAEAIERLGARDVFLAGWHPHRELPAFLNASDAIVHPSVNEQFGQVLVEAMACGLPAIAVDRGGPATIVEHEETGWLVPPDDVEALSRAITEAVNDPGERRSMGETAREEAVGNYAWESVGQRIAQVVREVIATVSRVG